MKTHLFVSLACGLFAVALLAGCGEPAVNTVPAARTDAPLTFALMLDRSDPIPTCAKAVQNIENETYGPNYWPDTYYQTSCTCFAGSLSHGMDEAGIENMAVRDAVQKLAMDMDLLGAVIRYEEQTEEGAAVRAFFNDEGVAKIGFDQEELNTALNLAGPAIQAQAHDLIGLIDHAPACGEIIQLLKERYPGIDPEQGEAGMVPMHIAQAIHRLEYDSGIDLAEVDALLHADDLEAALPQQLHAYLNTLKPEGTEPFTLTDAEAKAACYTQLVDKVTEDQDERNRQHAWRLLVVGTYSEVHVRTADEEDIGYYIYSKLGELGLTEEEHVRIASAVLDVRNSEDSPACLDALMFSRAS